MKFDQCLKTWQIVNGLPVPELFGGMVLNGPLVSAGASLSAGQTALVQAATVAINAANGTLQVLDLTTNVAFIMGAPTNPPSATQGQTLVLRVRNVSGGAHGAGTWNAAFLTAGNVPAIANGFSRAFEFRWNGTNWVETFRSAADIAN